MELQKTAKIAVSSATYAFDRPYQYLLAGEAADAARPGMRAAVPFGKGNRPVEGMILAIETGEPPEGQKLKQVMYLLDDQPVLDEQAIALALWMRERLYCTVYEAARAMLPAGLYYSFKNRCVLVKGIERERAEELAGKSEAAHLLLEILYATKDGISMEDLRAAFGTRSPEKPLRLLRQAGVVDVVADTSRQVEDKTEQYVTLALSAEEAFQQVEGSRKRWPVRYSVVELLSRLERVPLKELCYYTGASKQVLKTLEKKGIIATERQVVYRMPELPDVAREEPPVLNEEQERAFQGLTELLHKEEAGCALLYGVTGSGKTQVYLRLIRACLERGQDAIMLVPEIALTPQMLQRFRAQFGDNVAVLHSMLSTGQRYDQWKLIREGKAHVVIGTRSAVFAPVKNLGLVILDEEQENSYRSENNPRYHARDVAKYRCVQNQALLVLGSATPNVETMFYAKSGKYHLFTLTQRYNQKTLPRVFLADRKEDLRAGNPGNISRLLRQEIARNLDRGEQTILFLNRRGSSKKVICCECGETPTCDRCSVSLTYHKDNGRLMCHYCGNSRPMPKTCPSCGGPLSFVGFGTQKIEEELQGLFPDVKMLRMDQDTISASNNHEKMLSRFVREKIPILIGTQMVAKGLDFSNVTLVGVLDADQALYMESYRAAERTFSLITQVIGRAGRGERTGRAVIQTAAPGHPVIRFAAEQDYNGFYEEEIQQRALHRYPPFSDHYRVILSGENEGDVLRAGVRIREGAGAWMKLPALAEKNIQVYGPVAATILRVNNRYRYHINVYAAGSPALRKMLAELMRAAVQDKRNQGVSVFVDWNPID